MKGTETIFNANVIVSGHQNVFDKYVPKLNLSCMKTEKSFNAVGYL